MNTARAFGPAAVQGFPNGSHWIVRRAFYSNPFPLPPPSHWHSPMIRLVPVSRNLVFSSRDRTRERLKLKREKGKGDP
jgi:hypothetical protein